MKKKILCAILAASLSLSSLTVFAGTTATSKSVPVKSKTAVTAKKHVKKVKHVKATKGVKAKAVKK